MLDIWSQICDFFNVFDNLRSEQSQNGDTVGKKICWNVCEMIVINEMTLEILKILEQITVKLLKINTQASFPELGNKTS